MTIISVDNFITIKKKYPNKYKTIVKLAKRPGIQEKHIEKTVVGKYVSINGNNGNRDPMRQPIHVTNKVPRTIPIAKIRKLKELTNEELQHLIEELKTEFTPESTIKIAKEFNLYISDLIDAYFLISKEYKKIKRFSKVPLSENENLIKQLQTI